MYSKGISWIDDCRIPFASLEDEKHTLSAVYPIDIEEKKSQGWGTKKTGNTSKEQGRFPANLLVSDDMLNDGVISKSSLFNKTNTPIFDTKNGWNDNNISGSTGGGFNDKGTNSRYYDIDKWFNNLIDV
jgi:hypothetical protein